MGKVKKTSGGQNQLRCETCGHGCRDELALLKHRETAHLQRACAYCPSRFASIEELMGHYKADHPKGDPRKARPKLVLTSSHCKFCSQVHDSRTMYKFDWERREIVKCRCCDECDRDRRLVERNPGPSVLPNAGINWNRQEPGVKYKCFLCEVAFDHPLVARSHFTRCHGFPKDIELVAHTTELDEESEETRVELEPQMDDTGQEVVEVVEEDSSVHSTQLKALDVEENYDGEPGAKKIVVSDYRNSLFVSGNSRPRPQRRSGLRQPSLEYEIRAPKESIAHRDDSHRFDFEEDGVESTSIQLLPQEYAEEVTVVADF